MGKGCSKWTKQDKGDIDLSCRDIAEGCNTIDMGDSARVWSARASCKGSYKVRVLSL